jgi:hypothetical protein
LILLSIAGFVSLAGIIVPFYAGQADQAVIRIAAQRVTFRLLII